MSGSANAGLTGLNGVQEHKLKAQLRRICPSEPWVEAQIKTTIRIDFRGKPQSCRHHDSAVFPPGGNRTAMVRCPSCGVFTPPQMFEEECCLDHSEHEGWSRSPSAVAIERIQHYNVKFQECELEAETREALQREIASAAHRSKASMKPKSPER